MVKPFGNITLPLTSSEDEFGCPAPPSSTRAIAALGTTSAATAKPRTSLLRIQFRFLRIFLLPSLRPSTDANQTGDEAVFFPCSNGNRVGSHGADLSRFHH